MYIGTKVLSGEAMTLGEYNLFRGWTIRAADDPSKKGFLVVYEDGYMSWSPAEAFKAYRRIDAMTLGIAIECSKAGKKVARKGWNANGLFIVYQKGYPEGITCNKQTAEAWGMNEGDLFKCEPYLQINTVHGSHAMWVPSIGDALAEDWYIVE